MAELQAPTRPHHSPLFAVRLLVAKVSRSPWLQNHDVAPAVPGARRAAEEQDGVLYYIRCVLIKKGWILQYSIYL